MNDGGPAFPNEYNMSSESGKCEPVGRHGLSIRDYFAAKAMHGLITSGDFGGFVKERTSDDLEEMRVDTSIEAYLIADAMLAARKQKGEGK